ncbi:MAG: hypothetical protein ABI406_04990 [Ktedonobacteraceae bacterium]
MSRQHAVPSQPRQRARTPRSSVWIDPAVSTYLQGEQIEQSSPSLSPPVEPAKPIPQRASAQRLHAVNVRPRYAYNRIQVSEEGREGDPADIPTLPPPTTWEYESQEYTAESSLSTLSLIVDAPTHPRTPTPDIPVTPTAPDTPPHGMRRIEEMDTRPPAIPKSTIHGIVDSTMDDPQWAIEEQNTLPMQLSPASMNAANKLNVAQLSSAVSPFRDAPVAAHDVPVRALVPIAAPAVMPTVQTAPAVRQPQNSQHASAELTSWTAGDAAGSRYAQLVAARTGRQKSGPSFNLFDRLRWWLLHPGRFEFLLWLGGTILLMTVTCIFLLMMVFSVQGNTNGVNNRTSSSTQSTNGATSSSGVALALTNTAPLIAGQPLHLRGQGFSANGHVALTYDASKPFLNQGGQPVLEQTDGHGTFVATLNSPRWGTGQHHIVARDLATGHQATVSVTIISSAKMTTTTTSVTTPVVTATVQQGNNTPPVGQTPSVAPTTGITPTATPRQPTPTPTAGITPTATVGTTPTVTATPKLGETATVGITATAGTTATVGNTNPAVLTTQNIADSGGSAIPVGPWLWLLIGGYALAMLLFGFAGLVHKR